MPASEYRIDAALAKALPEQEINVSERVQIDYTNWRGERRERVIIPISISFDCNQWHPERQWLLLARDVWEGDDRTFAMANIHSWLPLPAAPKETE